LKVIDYPRLIRELPGPFHKVYLTEFPDQSSSVRLHARENVVHSIHGSCCRVPYGGSVILAECSGDASRIPAVWIRAGIYRRYGPSQTYTGGMVRTNIYRQYGSAPAYTGGMVPHRHIPAVWSRILAEHAGGNMPAGTYWRERTGGNLPAVTFRREHLGGNILSGGNIPAETYIPAGTSRRQHTSYR
jgi:hypothetical protein